MRWLILRLGEGDETLWSRQRPEQIAKPHGDDAKAPRCAKSNPYLRRHENGNRKPGEIGSRKTCPRTSASQRAAGGDGRSPQSHLGLADRSPAGVRQDRQERSAALPERAERRLPQGWRACAAG